MTTILGSKLRLQVPSHVQSTSCTEPVGGAPTTSVVAQESIVNALVVELILRRGFTAKDFKHNHPGGALGGAV
eukprot:m.146852 g.146852  ORF g.146852 m.146852 type:complete len:73 (+) comp23126_c1_seq5:89-307(+)